MRLAFEFKGFDLQTSYIFHDELELTATTTVAMFCPTVGTLTCSEVAQKAAVYHAVYLAYNNVLVFCREATVLRAGLERLYR